MRRAVVPPALAIVLGLLLGGCGGDEDADEPAAEPLSAAEFKTQADEICAEGNAALMTEVESMSDDPAAQEIESFAVDVFVPNLQAQHDDIAALGVPEGDEETVETMLDSLQGAIDVVDADPQALLDNDDPFNEFYDLAEDYGLEDCAL